MDKMQINTPLNVALNVEIDYEKLATMVAAKMIEATQPKTDYIEVAKIRAALGSKGRPMAPATFEKNFIKPGLIKYVPPTLSPNRNKRYVKREDWEKLATQI